MYVSETALLLDETPWRIKVYDGAFVFKGWIEVVEELSVTPRHNAIGTATFTLQTDAPRVADLSAEGARVVIELNGEFLMSGPVTVLAGNTEVPNRTRTFTVEDDFRILSQILGWPNPAGAITAQGDVTAYDTRTGPAETVVKGFVTANATRLGLPLTVATDLARGDSISIQMRMHPLTDRLYPAVDQAGIGVTVRQSGAGLVLDCYEPTVITRPVAEDSGILVKWAFTRNLPTVTRVVVGGQGEGTAREFSQVIDAARQTSWGLIAESFRDARDTDDPVVMTTRANEALAEGNVTATFDIELAETATFRYGRTLHVGDIVTVQVQPGVELSEVVRSVEITHTLSDGLTVTPKVGADESTSDDIYAAAIARLAARLRDLEAGR